MRTRGLPSNVGMIYNSILDLYNSEKLRRTMSVYICVCLAMVCVGGGILRDLFLKKEVIYLLYIGRVEHF